MAISPSLFNHHRLFPNVTLEIARVLRTGGMAVLLLAHRKEMRALLELDMYSGLFCIEVWMVGLRLLSWHSCTAWSHFVLRSQLMCADLHLKVEHETNIGGMQATYLT